MRFHAVPSIVLAGVCAGALAPSAGAQRTRVYTPAPAIARTLQFGSDDEPRAALGITTAGSSSARDTLGLLVSTVMANSPAEKAGIEEGNRIAAINGVNLKVASADAGDWEVSNAMSRRLTRELTKVRPGDDVELRVYSSGQTRSVRVKTADSDSLYGRRRFSGREQDDRPTLGISIGASNSRRDTLGVLVMFVDDSGPAARAGIEEGNRIASIDGVDLRVSREDAGDDYIANAKVRRLQREVSKLRPGDDVDLRVYANGQFRTMKLKVARSSDLSHRRGTLIITGDRIGMTPALETFPFSIDGAAIGGEVRRALERAMEGAGRAIEGVGRGIGGTRMYWQDDLDERPEVRIEPREQMRIEPLTPSRVQPAMPGRIPFRSAVFADSLPAMLASTVFAAAGSSDASMVSGNGGVSLNIGGLRLVPVGEELASYLGRGSERGLLVIDVPPWAGKALQAGDVVLRVENRPVRTGQSLEEVVVDLPRFRDATVDILRDGEHRAVTLPARR